MINIDALGQFFLQVALVPLSLAGAVAVVITLMVALVGFLYRLRANL